MNFLNNGLLPLLAPFVLLPLLIHLFNRKFPRRIIFSSIEFIKKTQAERSKLMRFRHLIMTLLRTLLVACLVLAFLKPLLDRFGSTRVTGVDDGAAGDALILFDHSLSMEHRSGFVPARKQALQEAEKIIKSLQPGQNLNAIAVARDPRACFFDFSTQHDVVSQFIHALPAGIQTADFEKAIALASGLINKSKNRETGATVYFISDFQRENWAHIRFDKLPESTRLFFVDVGSPDRPNRAILNVTVSPLPILAGETIEMQVKLGNFTPESATEVPLEVILNHTNAVDTQFSAPPWSEITLPLSMKAPPPGMHTIELRLPPDDLLEDNVFHLTLPVLDKEEVVIVTDRIDPGSGAPHFIRTAVNPYQGLEGSLLPRLVNSRALDGASLAATSKLILLELGALDENNASALVQYLSRGGGAIWFLDGDLDASNILRFNEALAGEEKLPVRLLDWQPSTSFPEGFQQLSRGNFKSDFLRMFRGANRQNLGLLHFTRYYQATAANDNTVLLSFADGTPALLYAGIGLGNLLLANFSLDEAHSNLARQRTFPAWLQDMVKMIATGESVELFHEAGTEISFSLWRSEARDLTLISPDGVPVKLDQSRDGERTLLSFAAQKPGFYLLSGSDGGFRKSFAVNPSPSESDLRLMDRDRLPLRAGETDQKGTSHDRAHFVSGSDDYTAIQKGTQVYHWFLLAFCGLLLVELFCQSLFRRAAG